MKAHFSIVLPVRNGGDHARICVRSILQQDYPYFRLHVLDNNSSDGTLEWIKDLQDERIEVHPSGTSLSIEENWSRILLLEGNEYLSLIGHDDVLMPDFLSTMAGLIEKNPESALFYGHFDFIDADGRTIRRCEPMLSSFSSPEFVGSVLKLETDITGTGFVCRMKDYKHVGGIPMFPKLLFADYALWIAIAAQKKGIVISEKNIFQFRLHQNTSQRTGASVFCMALKEFILFLKERSWQFDPLLFSSIMRNTPFFVEYYCKSLSNKLLRQKTEDREGITVKGFIKDMESLVQQLTEDRSYKLRVRGSLLPAMLIDSIPPARKLFRFIRTRLIR